MRALRIAFAVTTALLTASVALQLYFAGMGVFSHGEELWGPHTFNGRVVLPALILLSIALAAASRAGRRTVWLSVLLVPLLLMQTLIFIITGLLTGTGPDTVDPPLVAVMMVSLHPLNGLVILSVAFVVARRAWRRAFPSTRPGTGGEPVDARERREPASSV